MQLPAAKFPSLLFLQWENKPPRDWGLEEMLLFATLATNKFPQTFLVHDLGCTFCCWFAFLQLQSNLLWVAIKWRQNRKQPSGLKIGLTKKKIRFKFIFFLPEFGAEKRVRKSGRGRSFSLRVWFSPWIAKPLFLCWPLFPAGFSSWNGAYSRPGSWSCQDFRECLADGNLRPSCWYLRHRCLELPLPVS